MLEKDESIAIADGAKERACTCSTHCVPYFKVGIPEITTSTLHVAFSHNYYKRCHRCRLIALGKITNVQI